MNILDNVKGSPIRGWRVYCGPSLGWIDAPVFQDTIITGDHTVQPYQSIILCNLGGAAALTLPNLNTWLNQVYGSWPIYVKDITGNFSTRNLTVTPVAAQTIDGLATLTLVSDYASVIIRPRSDYLGWYST